eukprot:3907273-Rhodomonas_salina.1
MRRASGSHHHVFRDALPRCPTHLLLLVHDRREELVREESEAHEHHTPQEERPEQIRSPVDQRLPHEPSRRPPEEIQHVHHMKEGRSKKAEPRHDGHEVKVDEDRRPPHQEHPEPETQRDFFRNWSRAHVLERLAPMLHRLDCIHRLTRLVAAHTSSAQDYQTARKPSGVCYLAHRRWLLVCPHCLRMLFQGTLAAQCTPSFPASAQQARERQIAT